MEVFSAQMTASITPNELFIDFYNSIMHRYIEERKKDAHPGYCDYDELARAVTDMSEEQIHHILAKNHSLYILPPNKAAQPFDASDFYANKSRSILNHEFAKWFGTEKMAHLLMAETVADPQVFLHNFFSLTFFSLQLDLGNKKKHTLYLAISPGKYFKEWLAVIAQCDMKTKLNRLHNKPSSLFESYTTFVVKTDITDHDDIDLFLEKNIETILKYERMAWLGNAEAPEHNKLQWPANLQELTLFKDWFNIDVYDDSCRL